MDKINGDSKSSNSELIKRYRFLFTLPKSTILSFFIGISSYIILPLSYLVRFKPSLFEITTPLSLFIVISIIEFVGINQLLRRTSKIMNLRRLSISIAFSNIVCITLFLIFEYLFSFNKLISVYTLILFIEVAIYLFIFSPLLSGDFTKSLTISIFLIVPQLVIVLSLIHALFLTNIIVASVFGSLIISIVLVFLRKINKILISKFNIPTFELFLWFLDAWMNDDAKSLENFLQKHSQEKNTLTWLIHLETESGRKLAIVIPYIHPGPFHPIGSYNLVNEISNLFKSKGYDYCFVLHGPVDHTFNLCSKQAVNKYLNQLIFDKMETKHLSISAPKPIVLNGIRLTTFAFDDKKVVCLSSNGNGLEDYPPDLLDELSSRGIINELIIVDSHNSIGPTPSREVVDEIIGKLINELTEKPNKVEDVKITFTTVSRKELGDGEDIGYNGVGVLLMQIDNRLYAFVSVDANNALSSVRNMLLNDLQKYNVDLIDVTTSDTHFNATKVRNLRGYFLLGERTPQERFVSAITNTCFNLRGSLEPFKGAVKVWHNNVLTIKSAIYSDINNVVSESINNLKVGCLILLVTVIIGSFVILLT